MLVPRTYDGELFQPQRLSDASAAAPLEPVALSGKHMSVNGHAASATLGKRKKWRLRIVTVGTDSITGARLKSGRVVRVVVSPATTLERGGERGLLWGQLSALTEGDLIEVKGRRDAGSDTLLAHRVILQPLAHAATSMG